MWSSLFWRIVCWCGRRGGSCFDSECVGARGGGEGYVWFGDKFNDFVVFFVFIGDLELLVFLLVIVELVCYFVGGILFGRVGVDS